MRNAALNAFCLWIEDTELSQSIQISDWIVPVTQIIHIFCVAAALSASLLIALRLLGYFATELPFSRTFNRCWPVIKISLILLVITGTLLIIGEPSRSLANSIFQIKIILICLLATDLLIIKRHLVNPVIDWRTVSVSGGASSGLGQTLAVVMIVLLVGIVFAGRWIAYS